MPMGPAPLGLVYFTAIKFAGYTAMAYWLRSQYPQGTTAPWKVGLVRTIIGLSAGICIVFVADGIGVDVPSLRFYALLLPVRIAEWMLLLKLFYERPEWRWRRAFGWSLFGYLWSTLLDLPAIATAFMLPGGVWVC